MLRSRKKTGHLAHASSSSMPYRAIAYSKEPRGWLYVRKLKRLKLRADGGCTA